MFAQARNELFTLRDLMRFSVSRFNEAQLYFGHGSDNAWDEAAYLLLHTLHLPLDRLDPFMDARLTRDELPRRAAVLGRACWTACKRRWAVTRTSTPSAARG